MTQLELHDRFIWIMLRKDLITPDVTAMFGCSRHLIKNILARLKQGVATRERETLLLSYLDELERLPDRPKKCAVCGKKFFPASLANSQKTKICSSPECVYQLKLRDNRKWCRENPRHKWVFANCVICGKQFEGTEDRKYCSSNCRRIGRSSTVCKNCGKKILSGLEFCGETCRYNYSLWQKEKQRWEKKNPTCGWSEINRINDVLNSLEGGLY